jgi:hypothetical protein
MSAVTTDRGARPDASIAHCIEFVKCGRSAKVLCARCGLLCITSASAALVAAWDHQEVVRCG